MNFDSVEEVLAFAIEKEIEAAEFYETVAAEEKFSGARKTFEGFAKEERKHQALLEGFRDNQVQISEYKLKWVPDIKRSDYLVDLQYEPGMDYADILRLAMKREEKALKLYNEMSARASDADVVRLFQILSQGEAKHKGYLEGLYDDFMAAQGD